MDLSDELEKMAANAAHNRAGEQQASSQATVVRWQKLFRYSHSKAWEMIEQHRSNYCRESVSYEHWELVREEKEVQGYDREAYEHGLEIGWRKVKSSAATIDGNCVKQAARRQRYIVRLEKDLTPDLIRKISGWKGPLEVIDGRGQNGDERFCIVSSRIRQALLQQLPSEPTIVRIDEEEKYLSSESRYPTLGLDTTLPQFRPNNCEGPFLPAQDEYPVWCFFYGTLADSTVLTRHLSLTEDPKLYPASITGGLIGTRGGKYCALLDGRENGKVRGCAFQVMTKEHEDALRLYETGNYEVVRCAIEFDKRMVQGCTFRFVGEVDR
ncbi:hypothetical protein L207DRAFT_626998 [Hyaloscypha variabilis F]|uniref:Gamma-glutamylcyclotransferase AIG2-like domain-containing protein n=1 Tax=Hyaloscypha variabilis (strain UAMH 11265 / GT02V1 / F) TaxID=1149755 RepID=A0A2J6SBW0_HYAVF|nr:hypothetical protein L207DRAFT_626998 [Hyaloscypha variabilis F]